MNKQELINKIEARFGTGAKFLTWMGYKNPRQVWSIYKNNSKKVNLAFVKIIQLLENIEQERLNRVGE